MNSIIVQVAALVGEVVILAALADVGVVMVRATRSILRSMAKR